MKKKWRRKFKITLYHIQQLLTACFLAGPVKYLDERHMTRPCPAEANSLAQARTQSYDALPVTLRVPVKSLRDMAETKLAQAS